MFNKLMLASAVAVSAFGAQITLDLSGGVNGTLGSEIGVFPDVGAGAVTHGGITFNIAPDGTIPGNYWNAANDPSAIPSFAVPVFLTGVTHIYALLNTTQGVAGPPALARMTVGYDDGSFDVIDLLGNDDVRDFNVGGNTNTINGVTPVLGSGSHGTVNWYSDASQRLDAFIFALPAAALVKQVTTVLFENNPYALAGAQQLFVAGVTAQVQDGPPVPTPEPATASLLIGAGLVMIGMRKRG